MEAQILSPMLNRDHCESDHCEIDHCESDHCGGPVRLL